MRLHKEFLKTWDKFGLVQRENVNITIGLVIWETKKTSNLNFLLLLVYIIFYVFLYL